MATNEETNADHSEPIPAWRYRAGLGLFTLGTVLVVASPMLIPALGLNPAYIAVAIFFSEVITFSSVIFLGWRGLKQLKDKLFSFLKFDPAAPPVGRTRHRLGLFFVFGLSLILDLLGIALVFVAYARATPADPFPAIWGLGHEQIGWALAGLFAGSYVALVVGLILLGDNWWGRFQELFVWQGPDAR